MPCLAGACPWLRSLGGWMTGNAVELGIGDRCEMLITFHGDVKERVAGLGGVLDRRFKDRDQQLV